MIADYKYFVGCTSLDEVKTKFRKLAMDLHPDKGGSAQEFSVMIDEYNHIKDDGVSFPIVSLTNYNSLLNIVHEYPKTPKESVQHLTPEELQYNKAKAHFDRLREDDLTYDIIDDIIKVAKKEGLRKLWVYAEIKKNLELNIEHFKYATWQLRDTVATAHTIYKSYIMKAV